MSAIGKTTLALLLCSAVPFAAAPVEPPPTAAELRGWAEGSCTRAAKHVGIDYPRSLDRAIAGDPEALATLFRFTDSGWCDGAAAEGHCAILFGLLQRLGDAPFARVLRAQKKPVRKAVCDAVTAFPGFTRSQFPQTYTAGPH